MSLRQKVEALLPSPQSYTPRSATDIPEHRIPFVQPRNNYQANFWAVPDTNCYETACVLGQEYAGHYLQYLKDQQQDKFDNMLGTIVGDMNSKANSGFAVGFLSYLEEMLSEWVKDKPIYDQLIYSREESLRIISEVIQDDLTSQQVREQQKQGGVPA